DRPKHDTTTSVVSVKVADNPIKSVNSSADAKGQRLAAISTIPRGEKAEWAGPAWGGPSAAVWPAERAGRGAPREDDACRIRAGRRHRERCEFACLGVFLQPCAFSRLRGASSRRCFDSSPKLLSLVRGPKGSETAAPS